MTEEQKKYDKEYEEFIRNLELEKEKYKKEHPETASELIDETKNVKKFKSIIGLRIINNNLTNFSMKMN